MKTTLFLAASAMSLIAACGSAPVQSQALPPVLTTTPVVRDFVGDFNVTLNSNQANCRPEASLWTIDKSTVVVADDPNNITTHEEYSVLIFNGSFSHEFDAGQADGSALAFTQTYESHYHDCNFAYLRGTKLTLDADGNVSGTVIQTQPKNTSCPSMPQLGSVPTCTYSLSGVR